MNKLLLVLVLLLAPAMASAATLTFTADPERVGVGDTVQVTLAITSATPVNAFSGSVVVPSGWDVVGINDGNSVVSSWIERPTYAQGVVTFAGVTAGSFSGERGTLFALVLKVPTSGPASFAVRDVSVLRANGAGTAESVVTKPLTISVLAAAQGGFVEAADTTPPEPFSIYRVEIGGPSVTFSALDKGSGIDHYELGETRIPFKGPGSWRTAVAPQALSDTALTSDVYVKAVDRAGNVRVEKLARAHYLRGYEIYVLLRVLLLVLAAWWYKR